MEMKPIRVCTNLAYIPDFSTAIVFALYYCQAEWIDLSIKCIMIRAWIDVF